MKIMPYLFMLIQFLCLPPCNAEEPPITYGISASQDSELYVYRSEMRSMILAFFKAGGYNTTIKSLPDARIYLGLKNGSVEVATGSYRQFNKISKFVLPNPMPVASLSLGIAIRKDGDPKLKRVITINGLPDLEANFIRELAQSDVEFVSAPNISSAIDMLKFKRADGVITYKHVFDASELTQLGFRYIEMEKVNFVMMVSAKSLRAQAIQDKIYTLMMEMKASGKLESDLKKIGMSLPSQ